MHSIRLRGPWEYQPLARTRLLADGSTVGYAGALPAPGRAVMPSDWSATLGADFRGRVRYRRWFHRPTGLLKSNTIHLIVDQVDAMAAVRLNDKFLGELRADRPGTKFNVTALLRPRNELIIEVELPRIDRQSAPLPRPPGREDSCGGLVGEVRLEIV